MVECEVELNDTVYTLTAIKCWRTERGEYKFDLFLSLV